MWPSLADWPDFGKVDSVKTLVAPHLAVVRLEPMIEIIGRNEKCVQNALKQRNSTCFQQVLCISGAFQRLATIQPRFSAVLPKRLTGATNRYKLVL